MGSRRCFTDAALVVEDNQSLCHMPVLSNEEFKLAILSCIHRSGKDEPAVGSPHSVASLMPLVSADGASVVISACSKLA